MLTRVGVMLWRVATGIPRGNWTEPNERVDLNFDQAVGPKPMRSLRSVGELRTALEPARRTGRRIGLVPTMGALHGGHLSLIARARAECDVVVVSLFVNPAQFDERADLDRYPRQEDRDRELAARAGADLLFAPSPEDVYPAGFATSVEVLGLTDPLEGAVRGASHFRGVTTVVTKLLNMVAPDVAYFGQKDAQQVVVIRHLAEDLNLPVRIEACPTVREPDGLAMSSRNAHLSPDERASALGLHAALCAAAGAASGGERSSDRLLRAARETLAPFDVELEYLALVSPDTLEPVARLDEPALLAIAARVGSTRLIDNMTLYPAVPNRRPATRQPRLQYSGAADPAPEPSTPREAKATCSA
jgi:pantoate--beta-alanine ligase